MLPDAPKRLGILNEGDPASVGSLLRRFRFAAGLSQETLAERSGVGIDTVSAIERGVHRVPYRGTVAKLTAALGLSSAQRTEFENALADARKRPRIEAPPGSRNVPSALPANRNNLPEYVPRLVGRGAFIAEVTELVRTQRHVTLVGSGGIGKTSVALQVGAQLMRDFADGVWLIDLLPAEDSLDVAAMVAAELDVQQTGNRPVSMALTEMLERRELLLILDNCEHVIGEAAAMVEAIFAEAPGVRVLATSREPFKTSGERICDVMPLGFPPAAAAFGPRDAPDYPAVELFVQCAVAADRGFRLTEKNAPIVAAISVRLEGIALAIELAASRVKALGLANLAQRLEKRLPTLSGGRRTARPHHQTMRALIDWSYNLLGQDERRLFARLGIFVGGWTLQAAETVCGDAGLDPSRIVDLLTALVDKSQVVAEHRGDHTRYRLLESVREYALEKLDASGERQVLALGHARWVAAFAEEAEAAAWSLPRRPWIKSIAPERDNVRAALTWATASEDSVVLAGRIAAALGLFWFYSGQADEGRIRIEELLGRLSGAECAEVTAKLWGALAALRAGAGRVQAARRAIEAFERLGDRRRLAVSFLQLAIAYRQMAEFTDAMAAIDRSVALFRETGDDGSTYCASALGWRASALIGLERFEEARSIFEKDIALHDALRDAGRAAIERLHSAELEFAVGNVRAAIELVEHGIEMLRAEARETRLSNDYSQVVFYLNLAAYRLVLGEIEAASVAARRALKRAQQVQYPLYTAIAVQHFATIAALRGQPALASRLRGFVNEVYRVQGVAREPTERRIDDLLVETLRDAPATAEIERNLAAGALLSEAEAVRLSFALGEPRGRTVPSVKSPAEERGFAGNH